MKRMTAMIENDMVNQNVLNAHYGGQSGGVPREQAERAALAETERRLYAVRALREREKETKEELSELETLGVEALRSHSASLVRLLRPGMRLEPEEVHELQLATLRARLAADARELKAIDTALAFIRHDPYYPTVEAKYFRLQNDDDVADRLACDPSTVRRNRKRLVRLLALRLYGV